MPRPQHLGAAAKPTGSEKMTIYKLVYQFRRSLLHNDNPTPARIASGYGDRARGSDADSANAML
jgi:hypothetical protein